MRFLFLCLVIAAAALVVLATRHRSPPAVAVAPQPQPPAPARPASAARVADLGTEPDEATLYRLDLARYERIEKAGGLMLTLPSSGDHVELHGKLWGLHKESCRPTGYPAGALECTVTVDISLRQDGRYRGKQPEVMTVRRGANGWEMV